jgi:hypothetical protein
MVATSYGDKGSVVGGEGSTMGQGECQGELLLLSERGSAVDLVQFILEIEVDGWSEDPLQIVCRFVGS